MAESISQKDFFRSRYMHYMSMHAANLATSDDDDYDVHLELQDFMRFPQAFISEMMRDIMFLHHVL